MDQEQIREKIASFPTWQYQFDLAGNPTPIRRESSSGTPRMAGAFCAAE